MKSIRAYSVYLVSCTSSRTSLRLHCAIVVAAHFVWSRVDSADHGAPTESGGMRSEAGTNLASSSGSCESCENDQETTIGKETSI